MSRTELIEEYNVYIAKHFILFCTGVFINVLKTHVMFITAKNISYFMKSSMPRMWLLIGLNDNV